MNYKLSYWEKERFLNDIDVLVIGSGLVGLSAAIHLKSKQPKLGVAVFERGMLPTGASTRNAGFACFGSVTELMQDLRTMPEDEVLALVEQRWRGLKNLRKLVGDRHMDYQALGGYELFTESDDAEYQQCLDFLPELNQKVRAITGLREVYRVANDRLPKMGFKGVQNLLVNWAEGQVDTGKLMHRLLGIAQKKGVRVFNGIGVKSLNEHHDGVELKTNLGWTIQVPKVLVAVNGFAKKLIPDIDLVPARNQVLITKPLPALPWQGCFHYDQGYYYFRNINNRILLGGGRNLDFEGETTDQFGPNKLIRSALVQLLRQVICPGQEIEVDQWWTGIMGVGPVKKPIIKKHSRHVVVATRMSGMGVAIGSLVGKEGAELILKG